MNLRKDHYRIVATTTTTQLVRKSSRRLESSERRRLSDAQSSGLRGGPSCLSLPRDGCVGRVHRWTCPGLSLKFSWGTCPDESRLDGPCPVAGTVWQASNWGEHGKSGRRLPSQPQGLKSCPRWPAGLRRLAAFPCAPGIDPSQWHSGVPDNRPGSLCSSHYCCVASLGGSTADSTRVDRLYVAQSRH